MWVDPPWKLCLNAVDKLVKDCPAEFVMLGIKSNKPWAETLRTLRCEEVTLPKSVGNGFFPTVAVERLLQVAAFPLVGLGRLSRFRREHREVQVGVVAVGGCALDRTFDLFTGELGVLERPVRSYADGDAAGRGQALGFALFRCFR